MKTKKVLVKYDCSVLHGGLKGIGRDWTYDAQKGHELSKIGFALHVLKRVLGEKEYGEVFLAPDLAESCHKALLLEIQEDDFFIPEGITLFIPFSGPPIPAS